MLSRISAYIFVRIWPIQVVVAAYLMVVIAIAGAVEGSVAFVAFLVFCISIPIGLALEESQGEVGVTAAQLGRLIGWLLMVVLSFAAATLVVVSVTEESATRMGVGRWVPIVGLILSQLVYLTWALTLYLASRERGREREAKAAPSEEAEVPAGNQPAASRMKGS